MNTGMVASICGLVFAVDAEESGGLLRIGAGSAQARAYGAGLEGRIDGFKVARRVGIKILTGVSELHDIGFVGL